DPLADVVGAHLLGMVEQPWGHPVNALQEVRHIAVLELVSDLGYRCVEQQVGLSDAAIPVRLRVLLGRCTEPRSSLHEGVHQLGYEVAVRKLVLSETVACTTDPIN